MPGSPGHHGRHNARHARWTCLKIPGFSTGPGAQLFVGKAPASRARQCSGLGSTRGRLRLPDKPPPWHRISRGAGILPTAPEPEHSRARLARTPWQTQRQTCPLDMPENTGVFNGPRGPAVCWQSPTKPGTVVLGLRFNPQPFGVTRQPTSLALDFAGGRDITDCARARALPCPARQDTIADTTPDMPAGHA